MKKENYASQKEVFLVSHLWGPKFWAKINKTENCWEWVGAKNPNGYGVYHIKARVPQLTYLAHRIAWMLHHGTDHLEGCLLHKCDNPACCNPGHLFIGTRKDNVLDMVEKQRHKGPTRNRSSNTKIPLEKIQEMWRTYCEINNYAEIGRQFGVTGSTVRKILVKYGENIATF